MELKSNPLWKGAKNIIRQFVIKEWSICPMACNENAVALMVSKGYKQAIIDQFVSPKQAEAVIIDTVLKAVPDVKKVAVWEIISKHIDSSWIKDIDKDSIIKQIFENK